MSASPDSRTSSEDQRGDTREVIAVQALQLFSEKGYNGTSVRDVAKRSGIGIATLFHHYPAKSELLHFLMYRALTDLLDATKAASTAAKPDPVSQLAAIVREHVLFHISRAAESLVSNSELRSLSGEQLVSIISLRDEQQAFFDDAVLEGVRTGAMHVSRPKEASRAIVTMCNSIPTWYNHDGPLSPTELANVYVDLALSMLNCGDVQLGVSSTRKSRH